jgi:hypothetical protein
MRLITRRWLNVAGAAANVEGRACFLRSRQLFSDHSEDRSGILEPGAFTGCGSASMSLFEPVDAGRTATGCYGEYSLTFYETVGWRGLMEGEGGSLFPDRFPPCPIPFFRFIISCRYRGIDQAAFTQHSSHPLVAEGLTLVDGAGRRRVLGEPDGPRPRLRSGGSCHSVIRYLDESNAKAMIEPEIPAGKRSTGRGGRWKAFAEYAAVCPRPGRYRNSRRPQDRQRRCQTPDLTPKCAARLFD